MKEYIIVQGRQIDFAANVCHHLRSGWVCEGGVATALQPHLVFYQAMTREGFKPTDCYGPG